MIARFFRGYAMVDFTPPKYVIKVIRTLKTHGYPSCIVGGCVRDLLLGLTPHDWDVATAAKPEEVISLFPDAIPTGIKHGTVTVKVSSHLVEVTTFRAESAYTDHRHPDAVSFVGDLNTDLSRRDFTINAIAVTAEGTLIDPYRGVEDLRAKLIRCVGEPDKRFEEDALRMLRAFRFSSRLGFEIEDNTFQAIINNASLVFSLSAERVRDEIEKILLTNSPEMLFTAIQCGLLDAFLVKHPSRNDGLLRIAILPQKPLPRWALFCMILIADDCIPSVSEFLTSLRLDGRTIRCCTDACVILSKNPPSDPAGWKRLLKHYGVDSVECASLCWDAIYEADFESILKGVLKSGECFSLRNLSVNGDDLSQLGYKGKKLGEMLNFLLDYVIDYPENNQRELLLTLASPADDA